MLILFAGRLVEPLNLPPEIQRHQIHNSPVAEGFELPEQGIRMEELEVSLIKQALSKTAGNRSRAARLLGLSRDTLLYRMKKYAIA
jgi:DNA-binding NtrC family response regulator